MKLYMQSDFLLPSAAIFDPQFTFLPHSPHGPPPRLPPHPLMQLLALYMASVARLVKPHGPQLYLELDFATAFASEHLPGWDSLPFMCTGGRVLKHSVVDLKAAKAVAPEKLRLEQVTAACPRNPRHCSPASQCQFTARMSNLSPKCPVPCFPPAVSGFEP